MPMLLSFHLILSVKHTDDFAVELCADHWIQIMQVKIQRVLIFGAQGNQRLSVSRLQQQYSLVKENLYLLHEVLADNQMSQPSSKIKYSIRRHKSFEHQGECLVSTAMFKAGDVIFKGQPFSFVLLAQEKFRRCDQCFRVL